METKVIMTGAVEVKRYEVAQETSVKIMIDGVIMEEDGTIEVKTTYEKLGNETIFSEMIEAPAPKEGDLFCISLIGHSTLDKTTLRILEVKRGIDGVYYCNTDYIRYIEDKETEISKAVSEERAKQLEVIGKLKIENAKKKNELWRLYYDERTKSGDYKYELEKLKKRNFWQRLFNMGV